MTEGERNAQLREFAYSSPLSIYAGSVTAYPLHAPPVETFLKTPGDGPPIVSRGLLTPSEANRMHTTVNKLHKLALGRVAACPYDHCAKYFPLDDTARMQRHLIETHEADTCNFCDEPLYRHWSRQQRQNHYLTRHSELFATADKAARDAAVSLPGAELGRTAERETTWNFCARCGRDHTVLYNMADRKQHDNECYPGMEGNSDRPASKLDFEYCMDCGGGVRKGNAALPNARHHCRATEDIGLLKPFCRKCGLTLGRFSSEYQSVHCLNCKGCGNTHERHKAAAFCPWCGVEMAESTHGTVRHLGICSKRKKGGEGPSRSHDRAALHVPEPTRSSPELLCRRDCGATVYLPDIHIRQFSRGKPAPRGA